jgi:hypothetical protein
MMHEMAADRADRAIFETATGLGPGCRDARSRDERQRTE